MEHDVAIVGASAAGLYTATLLARAGIPVGLYERAPRIDPAPRTLIVTGHIRELLGPVGEPSIVNEIRRFELFADGKVAAIHLRRPDLIVERSELIRSLAREAEACGARLVPGRRFRELRTEAGRLTLTFGAGREEEVRAAAVVGADGAFSRVARAAGRPRPPTVPLLQAIVPLPDDLPADTVRVWFRPEDTPYFYWLIPQSPTRGALGVIGRDGQTRGCLDRFIAERGLVPIEYQAARVPLYRRSVPAHRRVGAGRVYLVGDAAGHVKVTTVGGVVTGFRGAHAVAEAILNGGPGRELHALRRELGLHLLIRRVLHRFTLEDYRRLLSLLDGPPSRVLAAYDRDQAGRLFRHLLLARPRLLLLGLRALLIGGSPSREETSERPAGTGAGTGGSGRPA